MIAFEAALQLTVAEPIFPVVSLSVLVEPFDMAGTDAEQLALPDHIIVLDEQVVGADVTDPTDAFSSIGLTIFRTKVEPGSTATGAAIDSEDRTTSPPAKTNFLIAPMTEPSK